MLSFIPCFGGHIVFSVFAALNGVLFILVAIYFPSSLTNTPKGRAFFLNPLNTDIMSSLYFFSEKIRNILENENILHSKVWDLVMFYCCNFFQINTNIEELREVDHLFEDNVTENDLKFGNLFEGILFISK